jgi:hypothetical protein
LCIQVKQKIANNPNRFFCPPALFFLSKITVESN